MITNTETESELRRAVPEDMQNRIVTIECDSDRKQEYEASVVLVTFGRTEDVLEQTLLSLMDNDGAAYEVLLLDNGTDWDLTTRVAEHEAVTVYVEFDDNYGPNVGRNLGARLANGEILIFLDDDADPAPDFVREHVAAHTEFDIVGARGRIYPKLSGFYGELGPRYDLGETPFSYPLDAEGNLSINRAKFLEIGGFDEELYGHEGMELTSRLFDKYGTEATIYYPEAVIYHDFVDGFVDLVTKKARHRHYRAVLKQQRPEVLALSERCDESPTLPETSILDKLVLYFLVRTSDFFAFLLGRIRTYEEPTR